MTARRRDTPVGSTFGTRTLGLLAVLAVAAAAYLAAPGSATATPISYTLSGVTATFPAFPRTYTITGTFTFDASDNTESALMITITGTDCSPCDIDQPQPFTTSSDSRIEGTFFFLQFLSPLSSSPDPVTDADVPVLEGDTNDVTGDAIFATPEPTSLALLAGAVGIFLLTCRANRRGRRA